MPELSDLELLTSFETGLNPIDLAQSGVPADVLGYGEISTVFMIAHDHRTAYKRMPRAYYRAYWRRQNRKAGL